MCGTTEYTCEGSSSFKERLPGVQSPQRISEVRRPHWAGKLTLKKAMTSAGLSEFSFSWNTSFNVENRVLSSMTFYQVGSLSTVGRRDSRGMTAIKTLVVRYAVIPSSQENDLSEMDESPETTRRMWPFWEASSSICGGCSHQMVWLARSDVSPCSLLPFMKQQLGNFFSIDVFTLSVFGWTYEWFTVILTRGDFSNKGWKLKQITGLFVISLGQWMSFHPNI